MTATATAQVKYRISVITQNLKERYARMPRPVLKAKGLSFRARCVYLLLLDYAGDKDYCFPSHEHMAEDLDTSVDTIQRGLQELKDYGLIDWKRMGFNGPNIYYILRLSDCANLRIVHPEPQQPDTAHMPPPMPQNGGNSTPQNCGSNETKSKENQFNETNLSKNAWSKGEDELTAKSSHVAHGTIGKTEEVTEKAPSQRNTESTSPSSPLPPKRAGEAKSGASPVGEAGRRPLQSFKKTQQQEKPPVFVGKPLTQDEIDAKKREGKNASGYTPLANIPAEHWQRLEAAARKAPVKPHATHYNNSTRNAPMFIDAIIEEFSTLLGDTENTAQNINRAAKLYRNCGLSEEEFRTLLYDSFNQAKRYPTDAIKKRRADGRPNRMPVFFGILEDRAAAR